MSEEPPVVLASASPRRKDLLRQIGIEPQIRVADVDETPLPAETPAAFVERLARDKVLAVSSAVAPDAIIIGADTAIELDGRIIGKPTDREDAIAILSQLSGRVHQVHTGVAVGRGAQRDTAVVSSKVHFRALSQREIEAYWRSGEPCDKAGAYAIQGLGAVFVERIEGSYSAIMGLPLFTVSALLARYGVDLLQA